jgi:hypothetical protein
MSDVFSGHSLLHVAVMNLYVPILKYESIILLGLSYRDYEKDSHGCFSGSCKTGEFLRTILVDTHLIEQHHRFTSQSLRLHIKCKNHSTLSSIYPQIVSGYIEIFVRLPCAFKPPAVEQYTISSDHRPATDKSPR